MIPHQFRIVEGIAFAPYTPCMNEDLIRSMLSSVQSGELPVSDAVERLRTLPFEDLGFATIDHHRDLRCGVGEVIFCQGKTPQQVQSIFAVCAQRGGNVLATRAEKDVAQLVLREYPDAKYDELGRTIALRQVEPNWSESEVTIVTAGTSDLPVAHEARNTAEHLDQRTRLITDVGVAGLHRLLAHHEAISEANVIVVVAGMEGALASVVGGLVSCPVIAVPTSVGYGASFGGLAALLAMLNSCAAGVTVVNIDNGFSAGYSAAMINRRIGASATSKSCSQTDGGRS
ncbi:MAG: 1-(5-phosphoribosyl)-5-amino-4-imidazole-carboxyl ate carboxylase [Phycisphaerae bacterium]|nr:MAG: 1-(5-phosphoribosyl)-5-amino-4-imidazole-carboxyl ate carboxylase [Phycisphaerae bacterium]